MPNDKETQVSVFNAVANQLVMSPQPLDAISNAVAVECDDRIAELEDKRVQLIKKRDEVSKELGKIPAKVREAILNSTSEFLAREGYIDSTKSLGDSLKDSGMLKVNARNKASSSRMKDYVAYLESNGCKVISVGDGYLVQLTAEPHEQVSNKIWNGDYRPETNCQVSVIYDIAFSDDATKETKPAPNTKHLIRKDPVVVKLGVYSAILTEEERLKEFREKINDALARLQTKRNAAVTAKRQAEARFRKMALEMSDEGVALLKHAKEVLSEKGSLLNMDDISDIGDLLNAETSHLDV